MIGLRDFVPGLGPEDHVTRARAVSLLPVSYELGGGGRNPFASDPQGLVTRHGIKRRGLDCSGLVCHALGLDRFQEGYPLNGGWINTDAIVSDARGPQYLFQLTEHPEIGMVLVFPGIDVDHDGDRDRIGHTAIVSGVPAEWNPDRPQWHLLTILDCAPSNSSKVPKAKGDVAEHHAHYFGGKKTFRGRTMDRWGTILCRYKPAYRTSTGSDR